MADYEVELGGVVFGCEPGDELAVRSFAGVGGAEIAQGMVEYAGADGSTFQGADRVTSRQIVVEALVDAADRSGATAETRMREITGAWSYPVRTGVVELRLRLAGKDYYAYGRPSAVDTDVRDMPWGVVRSRLAFTCVDPRLYSPAEQLVVLGTGAAGGFTAPVTFPYAASVLTDPLGDATAVNGGNFDTPWQAVLTGPLTDPRLIHAETGAELQLAAEVPAGSQVVIDAAKRTVRLDGSPRPTWVTTASRWWALAPGSNTVRFRASAGTGQATFTWRYAWL